jgi:endonuclease/exonuclease/phosphatase family metal-dependent hydrolase
LKDELFSFNDVVALNEAFSNSLTQKLVNGLGFPYKTEVLGNKLGNLLNGGVVVLSRYPIIESHEYIYSSSCAEDSFANKGFIHVKIRKDGRLYNIIATHTQADPVLPCSDVARVRENQFREIRQYIEEKIQDRSEYLYVIGDLNTDQTYSEFNNMLSILDVEQPEYAGLKYSWDFRLNTLASKSYYDYEGSPLRFDYLFSVNGFAQPRAWHNIILDPIVKTRIEHDDGISHFHFVDPSDHFPAIGFEYLDGTIPERSFRGQNKRYDSIRFKHQLTGSYLRAGAENDYVFIQPQQGERDNEWAIDTFYPSYWLANDTQAFPTCILNDMGVEIESLKYKGKFLVWDLFYPSYYVLGSTSSKWLTIEKVDENGEPAAGCLEDGDKVFIKDATDLADWSFAKQYISRDISYFRVNDYRNEADTFIVEMPKANLLDWSNLPR